MNPLQTQKDIDRPRSGAAPLVGNTPLIRLRFLEPRPTVEVYGKAEWVNPGGSVKDRAALRMIQEGERTGRLRKGMTLLDASSGNTGISYALLGKALGYAVKVILPANVTRSRLRILAEYGAEVVTTDPLEGMDGAIETVRRMYREDPGRYFYPDQYNNPENWLAHFHGTGPEILRQTQHRVTHFVAGLGTTGTFVGTGRALKLAKPDVRLAAFQPDSPLHALEGLKHLATTRHVPGIYDPGLADDHLFVSTEDARETAFRIHEVMGIQTGPSAAAAATAAGRIARSLESGVVVTVLPDSADKYLEEPFWS